MTKPFTITKRIAKHGLQAIIVIPKLIQEHLKPGTIVEAKIEVINDMNPYVQEKPINDAQSVCYWSGRHRTGTGS